MFGGHWELLIVVFVALLLFGHRLPSVMRSLGRGVVEFKRGVQGVENEELLALCHELPDVGCGYYPNGKFVHFDIRFRGRGLWVDAAAPGEPSRYVDGWPGVVERGRVVWKKP